MIMLKPVAENLRVGLAIRRYLAHRAFCAAAAKKIARSDTWGLYRNIFVLPEVLK
jgi:hypothetical protein